MKRARLLAASLALLSIAGAAGAAETSPSLSVSFRSPFSPNNELRTGWLQVTLENSGTAATAATISLPGDRIQQTVSLPAGSRKVLHYDIAATEQVTVTAPGMAMQSAQIRSHWYSSDSLIVISTKPVRLPMGTAGQGRAPSFGTFREYLVFKPSELPPSASLYPENGPPLIVYPGGFDEATEEQRAALRRYLMHFGTAVLIPEGRPDAFKGTLLEAWLPAAIGEAKPFAEWDGPIQGAKNEPADLLALVPAAGARTLLTARNGQPLAVAGDASTQPGLVLIGFDPSGSPFQNWDFPSFVSAQISQRRSRAQVEHMTGNVFGGQLQFRDPPAGLFVAGMLALIAGVVGMIWVRRPEYATNPRPNRALGQRLTLAAAFGFAMLIAGIVADRRATTFDYAVISDPTDGEAVRSSIAGIIGQTGRAMTLDIPGEHQVRGTGINITMPGLRGVIPTIDPGPPTVLSCERRATRGIMAAQVLDFPKISAMPKATVVDYLPNQGTITVDNPTSTAIRGGWAIIGKLASPLEPVPPNASRDMQLDFEPVEIAAPFGAQHRLVSSFRDLAAWGYRSPGSYSSTSTVMSLFLDMDLPGVFPEATDSRQIIHITGDIP